MKKYVSVIIATALLLYGCAEQPTTTDSEITATEEATTIQETTEQETTEQETTGNWSYQLSKDEFGDIVSSDGFIVGMFTGDFSNSATLSSDLLAGITITNATYSIHLYEYGNIKADFSVNDTITLKTKDDSGKTTEFSNKNYDFQVDENVLMFSFPERDMLQKITDNEHLKFYISVESKYGNKSEYRFETNNSGLKDVITDNDIIDYDTLLPHGIKLETSETHWFSAKLSDLFYDAQRSPELLCGNFDGFYYANSDAAEKMSFQIIFLNDDDCLIRLLESDSTISSVYFYGNEDVKLTIKGKRGTKTIDFSYIYKDTALCFEDAAIMGSLLVNDTTDFVIEVTSFGTTTTYKFTVEKDNMYDIIKGLD